MNHLQIIQDKFVTKVWATIFGARCKPLYIGSCTVHRWLSHSSNDVENEISLLVLYYRKMVFLYSLENDFVSELCT